MDNELATNFANESLANLIFKKKLVPLLFDKHFALATSFQHYGYKAWKEFREASLEINFYNKRRDKKLPQQLRREQLDHKTFWSASFKALCLNTFDGNSFKKETFEEETFTEESFADSSLEEETFSESNLEDSNLEEETFSESSLEDSSLEEETFSESSLEDSSLELSTFEEGNFDYSSFTERSFEKNSFDKHSFYKTSLEESSFEESSLEDSSFEQSNFRDSNFPEDSFQDKNFARKTSPTELERRALAKAAYSLEFSPTTAQLDGKLGLFLGGGSLHTSPRRGGVLRAQSLYGPLALSGKDA